MTGDLNGMGCSAPFSAEPGSLEHLSIFGDVSAVFGLGVGLPGPFQNLGDGALWCPVIATISNWERPSWDNLTIISNIAGVIWRTMVWSCVHLIDICLRLHLKKYLINHLVSRSTETNTPQYRLDIEKISKGTFMAKWDHVHLKRGGTV